MNPHLFLLLLSLPYRVWSQSLFTTEFKRYCPDQKPVYIPPSDTLRRQVILDSINTLLIGKWQLIQTEDGGWSSPRTRKQLIEMTIDEQGHTTIYQEHKQVINFQLAAGLNFGYTRCVIDEPGRDYFKLRSPIKSSRQGRFPKGEFSYPNGLRVCDEALVIYAFTSAGPTYIFKRLTPIQLKN